MVDIYLAIIIDFFALVIGMVVGVMLARPRGPDRWYR